MQCSMKTSVPTNNFFSFFFQKFFKTFHITADPRVYPRPPLLLIIDQRFERNTYSYEHSRECQTILKSIRSHSASNSVRNLSKCSLSEAIYGTRISSPHTIK